VPRTFNPPYRKDPTMKARWITISTVAVALALAAIAVLSPAAGASELHVRPKIFAPNGLRGYRDSTYISWSQNKPMDAVVKIRGCLERGCEGFRVRKPWVLDNAVGRIVLRWNGKGVLQGAYKVKLIQSDATDGDIVSTDSAIVYVR
jgi:hypothetical protein